MPEGRRPDWFHVPAPGGPDSRYNAVKESVRELKLATVCEEVWGPPDTSRLAGGFDCKKCHISVAFD
jgi:lipoate synthase